MYKRAFQVGRISSRSLVKYQSPNQVPISSREIHKAFGILMSRLRPTGLNNPVSDMFSKAKNESSETGGLTSSLSTADVTPSPAKLI